MLHFKAPPEIVLASNLKLIIIDKQYRTNLKGLVGNKKRL